PSNPRTLAIKRGTLPVCSSYIERLSGACVQPGQPGTNEWKDQWTAIPAVSGKPPGAEPTNDTGGLCRITSDHAPPRAPKNESSAVRFAVESTSAHTRVGPNPSLIGVGE